MNAPVRAEGPAAAPSAAWRSRPGCGLGGPVTSLSPRAVRGAVGPHRDKRPSGDAPRSPGPPRGPRARDAAPPPRPTGAGEWLLPSSASCWPPSWIWCCCFPRMHRGPPGGWSPRTSWSGGGAGGALPEVQSAYCVPPGCWANTNERDWETPCLCWTSNPTAITKVLGT